MTDAERIESLEAQVAQLRRTISDVIEVLMSHIGNRPIGPLYCLESKKLEDMWK